MEHVFRSYAVPISILALILFIGCGKNHPDDIPGWVKDQIRWCDRLGRDCNGLEILEYADRQQRYYYFAPRKVQGRDQLFNEVATLLCEGDELFLNEPYCSGLVLDSLHIRRLIYTER